MRRTKVPNQIGKIHWIISSALELSTFVGTVEKKKRIGVHESESTVALQRHVNTGAASWSPGCCALLASLLRCVLRQKPTPHRLNCLLDSRLVGLEACSWRLLAGASPTRGKVHWEWRNQYWPMHRQGPHSLTWHCAAILSRSKSPFRDQEPCRPRHGD